MLGTLSRWVLWLAVVVLLIVAVVLLVLNTSVGHGVIKQGLQRFVHPELDVRGKMAVGVWPTLSLQANDVSIVFDGPHSDQLNVSELRLSVAWWPLRDQVLHIEQAHISDVTLTRSTLGSGRSIGSDLLSGEAFKRRWNAWSGWQQTNWQLKLDRLVVERLAFGQGLQEWLALDRAELTAVMLLTPAPLGEVTVRADGIAVAPRDPERMQAALEQVGLGDSKTLLVDSMQGRWQLSDGMARAVRWQASGPWGEVSADNGAVDLRTGQTVLPMRVQLKGQLNHQHQGVQIQTRQADIRFILQGPIDNLGINPP